MTVGSTLNYNSFRISEMHSATLNLKLDPRDCESLELIDELDSIMYPQPVLEQYFTGLFEELATRGSADFSRIHRSVFIDVCIILDRSTSRCLPSLLRKYIRYTTQRERARSSKKTLSSTASSSLSQDWRTS